MRRHLRWRLPRGQFDENRVQLPIARHISEPREKVRRIGKAKELQFVCAPYRFSFRRRIDEVLHRYAQRSRNSRQRRNRWRGEPSLYLRKEGLGYTRSRCRFVQCALEPFAQRSNFAAQHKSSACLIFSVRNHSRTETGRQKLFDGSKLRLPKVYPQSFHSSMHREGAGSGTRRIRYRKGRWRRRCGNTRGATCPLDRHVALNTFAAWQFDRLQRLKSLANRLCRNPCCNHSGRVATRESTFHNGALHCGCRMTFAIGKLAFRVINLTLLTQFFHYSFPLISKVIRMKLRRRRFASLCAAQICCGVAIDHRAKRRS